MSQTQESNTKNSERHGLESLRSWQKEIAKRFVEGESLLVLLPSAGGKGHSYIPYAKEWPGLTLVVIGTPKRLKQRQTQITAEGNQAIHWSTSSPWPNEAQGLLLVLEEDLQSLETPPWDESNGPTRLILDTPLFSQTPPAWWTLWGQSLLQLLLPSQPARRDGWWNQSENVPKCTLLIPPPEELQLTLKHDDRPFHEFFAPQYISENIPTHQHILWLGNHSPQLPEESTITLQHTQDGSSPSNPSSTSVFFLHSEHTPGARFPTIAQAIFEGIPPTLHRLGLAARSAEGNVVIATNTPDNAHSNANPTPPSPIAAECLLWLQEHRKNNPSETIYISASQLLQETNTPITPQPTFERHLQELDNALQWMLQIGLLKNVEETFFHVKIHQAQRLKPIFLQAHPHLLQFWEQYQEFQRQLPPLASLKFSLLHGHSIDLREVSTALQLPIQQVASIFTELDQKGLIVAELQHDALPYNTDKELLLTLGHTRPFSRAVQLWSQCENKKSPLLWASLSQAPSEWEDELSSLWALPANQMETWKQAWALTQKAKSSNRMLHLAARLLAHLDTENSPAALLLWQLASADLALPGLAIHELQNILPSPQDAQPSIGAPLRHLIEHLNGELRQTLESYALDLPLNLGFVELATQFAQKQADHVLAMEPSNKDDAFLQKYARQTKTIAQQDTPPTWAGAAAWCSHLLQQKDTCKHWLAQMNPQTPQERWRQAQMAISSKTPALAIETLLSETDDLPASQEEISKLRSLLLQECFSFCNAQNFCQSCKLKDTTYCPAEPALFLAQKSSRSEEPNEQFGQRLTKRLRADLGQQPTEWLQALLEEGAPGKQFSKVERITLRCLADRKAANPEQLQRISRWCEKDGDFLHALSYRRQLLELDPQNAENLHQLARLILRLEKDIQQALRWALEASHADPRNYPLEPFLNEHGDLLLADLDQLRELLIELPAHPALSTFEQELTRREEVRVQLTPILQQTEELLEKDLLAQAHQKAQETLDKEPRFAPLRFREIIEEVEKRRELLIQIIERPQRREKNRNKALEDTAEEALALGFPDLASRAFQKLLHHNPHYGLGFLKWARICPPGNQRDNAYQKAITLSRSPEQMRRNLDEFATVLSKEGNLLQLLPLLLQLLQEHPNEVSETIEPTFIQLIERHGSDEKTAKKIEQALKKNPNKKAVQHLEQSLEKMNNIDPWKRTLLSLKLKK